MIYLSVTNSDEIDAVLSEVEYAVLNQADVLETLGEITHIFTLFLGGIAGISLLVGGIGVMNIMLVSVTERTREIGIRKALGAKEYDILMQFLTESTLLSVVGGIIGIVLSGGIISFAADKMDMDMGMTLDSVLLAFAFSASVGIFFWRVPRVQSREIKTD